MQIKLLEGKKAQTKLLNVIFQIIAALFLLISLLVFIDASSKKEFIEQRNLVKELALTINYAASGTTIKLTSPFDIALDKTNQTIAVGSYYKYSFFRKKVELRQELSDPSGSKKYIISVN
jgi:hypothetical protein